LPDRTAQIGVAGKRHYTRIPAVAIRREQAYLHKEGRRMVTLAQACKLNAT
jgi:hypothetical protein